MTSAVFSPLMLQLDPIALEAISVAVRDVEAELRIQADSAVPIVAEVNQHTLGAGGKRLRPAFVVLSANAAGKPYEGGRAIRCAACLELVHMATLIHDDVIDHASTRRGRPTASSLFGNTASILSGDVLLARSMVILAEDGDLDVIRCVSRAVVEMAEGEALEVTTRDQFELTQDDHFAILRMKTASFVECCCRVGGLVAGANPEIVSALAAYGHNVGMAFQIIDDILDYRGDQAKTGKPRATDFREGCATLPLMLLRDRASAEDRAWLEQHFGCVDDEAVIDQLLLRLDNGGAFVEAETIATGYADEARLALRKLPDSPDRDLLNAAIEFVLQRSS